MDRRDRGFAVLSKNAIYVAYQGDVTDFQSLRMADDLTDKAYIHRIATETMRACLVGWWSRHNTDTRRQLTDDGVGFFEVGCVPSGFVVRVQADWWWVYEVTFDDDSLESADVELIESGTGQAPLDWLDHARFWNQ